MAYTSSLAPVYNPKAETAQDAYNINDSESPTAYNYLSIYTQLTLSYIGSLDFSETLLEVFIDYLSNLLFVLFVF